MKISTKIISTLAAAVFAAAVSVGTTAAGDEALLLSKLSKGDTTAVYPLIDEGFDVNATQPDGTSALHWAVYYNDEALVEKLLDAGAEVNTRNAFGSTPLQQAAINAQSGILELLLDAGANVNEKGADGQTPLMVVVRTSNTEAAELLLDEGADPNAVEDWRGQTALMWAAAQNQPGMVELLLDAGADPDAQSLPNNWERQVTAEPRMKILPVGGFTALLYASREGCEECISHLADAGADLDKADPEGVTALLMATMNARWDAAKALIEAGANVDRWDIYGRNPLYAAVDYNTLPHGGRPDKLSKSLTSNIEIIEMLIAAGANVNMQLKLFPPYRALGPDRGADRMLRFGVTPLFRAARGGDLDAMKLLLDNGARTDLTNENGVTILMAASGYGQSDIDTRGRFRNEDDAVAATRLLLENSDLDINAQEETGQTALIGAASRGWTEVVKLLVEHGADPVLADSYGMTPLDAAMGRGATFGRDVGGEQYPETAAYLQDAMVRFSEGI